MDRNQKLIIDILKSSINSEKFFINNQEQFDWKYIIKESRDHQISSLIYYMLDNTIKENINKNIMSDWKKEVIISNVIQKKNINNIEKILIDLKKKNVELILLKGLVLRSYYPKPELRSMSDVDFLIKKQDYDVVKKYLINNGYRNSESQSDIHEEFISYGNFEIELHLKLVNNDYIDYEDTSEFEKNVWENLYNIKMNNITLNTMSLENFLIHLCFHMAVHIITQGIGLRQIYDVAVFVKSNFNYINWTDLYERLSEYKILRFSKGIFILVNSLFNVNFPKEFLNDDKLTQYDVNLLLENILISGVHGRKMHVEGFENLYGGISNTNYRYAKLKKFIRFLFPDEKNMKKFYEKNHKKYINLPLGWFYRINIILFKEYGINNSIKHIKEAFNISDMRTNIIKTYDL